MEHYTVTKPMEKHCKLREKAMVKCHLGTAEYHDLQTGILPALSVNDLVLMQNQTGNHPCAGRRLGAL